MNDLYFAKVAQIDFFSTEILHFISINKNKLPGLCLLYLSYNYTCCIAAKSCSIYKYAGEAVLRFDW